MSGMDLLTENEIESYNSTRNNGAEPQKEIVYESWQELSSMFFVERYLRKKNDNIYVKIYYAEWKDLGYGLLVEDSKGVEIDFIPCR